DPARLAAGRDAAPGAGARAGLEAPVRVRRGADTGALLPRREVVARGPRRGPAGAPGRRSRGRRATNPARKRPRAVSVSCGCLTPTKPPLSRDCGTFVTVSYRCLTPGGVPGADPLYGYGEVNAERACARR